MKVTKLLLVCLVSCCYIESSSAQDGWRNFVPLQTTRKEVEKLLGPPEVLKKRKPLKTFRWYKIEKGLINVSYSFGRCKKIDSLQWKVPAGLVTHIYFEQPKQMLSLTEWGFNVEGYKKEKDPYNDWFYYTSPDESLVIGTRVDNDGKETVDTVEMFPGVKNNHLLCPQLIAPKNKLSPTQPR